MGEVSHLGLHNLLSEMYPKQWPCQSLGRSMAPAVCGHQAELTLHSFF